MAPPGNPSLLTNPRLARWLTFEDDGGVVVRTGKSELGQGIDTALIQVVSDALAVSPDRVRLAAPDTSAGPDEGFTAGSLSVQQSAGALLAAASHARSLFAAAAEDRIGPVSDVVDGTFVGAASSLTYWDLRPDVDLDVDVPLEAHAHVRDSLVGTNVPRVDLADKILGRPRFLQDMRVAGMAFGRVIRPPYRGARLEDVDAAAVAREAGVLAVVEDGSVLGVVAESEILAREAADRLRASARWSGEPPTLDDSQVVAFLTGVDAETTVLADGPAVAAPALAARYTRPFLAHASIGPACAMAVDRPDGLVVWSHTQGVFPLRRDIARALGRDEADVEVRHVEGAGCYGHNPADDAAYDAALLAVRVPGRPVHVTWTREDEMGWAPFGPAMVIDIAAATDTTGRITAWSWDGYGNGHSSRPSTLPTPSLLAYGAQSGGTAIPPSQDPPQTAGAGTGRNAIPGYDVGPVRARAHRALEMPMRASALRSLGAHMNVFAIESHLDDLARMHAADPLEYRLRHLDDPRGRAVLERAAQSADWGRALPDSRGRGVGYARYKGTGAWCAVIAEVEAVDAIRVMGLWIAVDCGRVISPDGVANQIEGGAIQSLSWTLKERVRFADGAVTSNTWEEYPILTFAEVPPVHVSVIDRPDRPWLGAGEASMGPTAAAVGNALVDAIGVRVRDLPITPEAIVAAME
jgi:CO/xanthine dehydrogenase Mo-binding subunit